MNMAAIMVLAHRALLPCSLPMPPATSVVVRAVEEAGWVIPGAKVRARGNGNRVLEAVTDRDGCAFLEAPAGKYRIGAELSGFALKSVKNVRVKPGAKLVQVRLELRVFAMSDR